MFLNCLQGGCSCISCVSTQMLVSPDRQTGSLNHDGIRHRRQLRHIMPIGSGHDERQRDATTVHQQMALAPIFSPDPSGWVQRFAVPVALSSSHHQCFAIARLCLQTRRTRQVRASTGLQRRQLSPIPGSGRDLRWHCRSAQPGVPSTGSLCVEQTRCPRIPIAGLWACVRLRTFGHRFDLQRRWRTGISGSTRLQNSSVTSHAFAFAILPPHADIACRRSSYFIYG